MPTGPSSSTAPYILASEPNVRFVSITTTGDPLPSGGVFGGIPDGIGAFDNGDGTITVLVNHEIRPADGIVRDHGAIGAYVDRLVIDATTLEIVSSDDLIQSVQVWDDAADAYVTQTTVLGRFCSGDLAQPTAFFNPETGLGSNVRIYLTGEETGPEGRGFATLVTGDQVGTAFELPYLGNLSYENLVASPLAQDKTIVVALDDGLNGQVYIYVGDKQATGPEIEKAGLSGGSFYGIKVDGIIDETNGAPVNGAFTLQEIGNIGDVSNLSGAAIDADSEAQNVTSFLRPEDGAWDPDNPNTFYFATTNSFDGNTRIYRLTFTNIAQPELGGTIEAVLDGTEGLGAHMFDNLTVANGKVIINEDPGNNGYLARVWEYDIASDTLTEVAQFDPALFAPGADDFITQDEESSGVLDVTDLLGDSDTRAYLLDAQIHALTGDPATVEGGQLLVMYVDDPFLIGGNGADNLFGSAADEILRGFNGDDIARSGSGTDQLFGGNGEDRLDGGAGVNSLFGERGGDLLIGGAGDDILSGGQGADYFIIDNSAESGFDRIVDFSGGDRVLTTVQLADGDGDGIIPFGADSELDLFGSSELQVRNGAQTIGQLAFTGTVLIDGTTYYSYGLASGDLGGGPALLGVLEQHGLRAAQHELFA